MALQPGCTTPLLPGMVRGAGRRNVIVFVVYLLAFLLGVSITLATL